MERLRVIGGVAAGPAAAAKAKRLRPDLDVVVFEAGSDFSYGVCELPYWIGGIVSAESDLTPFTVESMRAQRGVEVRLRHAVREILPGRRLLVVEDLGSGQLLEEPYDHLVIATGSRAVPPPWGTGRYANAVSLRSLADARQLQSLLREIPSGGRAVILGAGYVGLEMAEALRRRHLEVTLIDRSPVPGPQFEAPVSEWIAKELTENGVTFLGNSTVSRWSAAGERLQKIDTTRGELSADLFVATIGFAPATELAAAAGVVVGASGALAVDRRQQTNLPAIYAAGDCAEVVDRVSGRPRFLPQAGLALRGGRVAAANIAGERTEAESVVGSLGVRAFRLELAQTGLTLAQARAAGFDAELSWIESWSRISIMPCAERLRVALVTDKRGGRLLGASVAGRDGAALRVDTLAAAIAAGWNAKQLADLDLMYTPPFAPLNDPLTLAARQAGKLGAGEL